MTPKMSNMPQSINNQIVNRNQEQQAPPQGFTDRNPRNESDFNQEQRIPAINNFDDAKIVQVIPNQNIIPMRNVTKGTLFIVFVSNNKLLILKIKY